MQTKEMFFIPFSWFHQSDAGWEEYYDYIFPEDAANQPNLKLLAMAKMWKRQQINTDEPQEKGRSVEEATSVEAEETGLADKQAEEEPARNMTESEQEKTYDDRDDEDSSSDSDEDEKAKKKQSKSPQEDKD